MMAKLGDVCTISSSNKQIFDDRIWLLNLDMVEQQTGNILSYHYVKGEELNGSIVQFDADNVLYSKLRPNLNKVVTPDRDGYATSELLPLKPDKNILCREYLAAFLRSDSFVAWAVSKTVGAKMPRLGTRVLLDKEIPLPPLDEQRKIAAVLDKVSDLIAKRRQQLDKLDLLVKARFVEMFGDLRSNKHGWDFLALSQLCDVRDGTHDSPQYMSKGYPLLTSKNFTSGTIDFTDCNLISKEDFDKINQRSNVDVGDIIMPMIGTIGNPVIVDTKRPFAIKNVALIKFVNNQVSNVFIRHLLTSDYFKQITFTFSRGGTQKFVALGDIRKLPIPLVPSQLQNQFAAFVKQTENTKTTISHSLEKLETLKKALMQEYFE